MPVEKNFDKFYNDELKNLLLPLEQERRKVKGVAIPGFAFLGLGFVLFICQNKYLCGCAHEGPFI